MDNNFLNYAESMKNAALGMCNELTNMINKEFENAGPEHAEKFKVAKDSAEAIKEATSKLKNEIGNFNKMKF